MAPPETFRGEITVSSKIVDYLSSGLYDSPAACLKELINNSYDADAREVKVFVKPDADYIIIEDNGIGMAKTEFERHFKRISESHKRDKSDSTPSGRRKIGKIGIGFIAANEICDVMEIYSTQKGSNELLHVNINFDKMRMGISERAKESGDVAKADYEGEVLTTDTRYHYTQVFLKSVRGEARHILSSAKRQYLDSEPKLDSLYGLKPSSVARRLSASNIRSWDDFDTYSVNLLRVALNVPIPYFEGWIPEQHREKVKNFEDETSALEFNLKYDGADLRKPIILNTEGAKSIISVFEHYGEHVSAKGYFFVRHGAIRPKELNGILLRIRHAAVGDYDSSFLGFPSTEGTLFQKWISAEIWSDDMEDALNIDRCTLRISHPAYVELQKAVHNKLSEIIREARRKLYDESKLSKNELKAKEEVKSIKKIASRDVSPLSPSAAEEMISSWTDVEADERLKKRLLKKFSVQDLYRVVVSIAREIMTEDQLKKFLRKLTELLTD